MINTFPSHLNECLMSSNIAFHGWIGPSVLYQNVLLHDNYLTDWNGNAGQHSPYFMCISDVNAPIPCPNEGFVLCCHTDIGTTISTVKTGQLPTSFHPPAPYSD